MLLPYLGKTDLLGFSETRQSPSIIFAPAPVHRPHHHATRKEPKCQPIKT
jgi:hypothetical protein